MAKVQELNLTTKVQELNLMKKMEAVTAIITETVKGQIKG
jgi:hypothetical protein